MLSNKLVGQLIKIENYSIYIHKFKIAHHKPST